jgi:hypothetical protein
MKLTGATVRHDGRSEKAWTLQFETHSFVSFHEEVSLTKICVHPSQAHAPVFSRINKVQDSMLSVWRCWHVMVTGTRLLYDMRPSGESRESACAHFVVTTPLAHGTVHAAALVS